MVKNPTNSRNGHYDDGSQLKCGQTKCPNCGSKNFVESVSLEKCYDCGLECNYWGGGANEVYEAMCRRHAAEQEERDRQYWENWHIENS